MPSNICYKLIPAIIMICYNKYVYIQISGTDKVIVGDFNTPLSSLTRTSKIKVSNERSLLSFGFLSYPVGTFSHSLPCLSDKTPESSKGQREQRFCVSDKVLRGLRDRLKRQ